MKKKLCVSEGEKDHAGIKDRSSHASRTSRTGREMIGVGPRVVLPFRTLGCAHWSGNLERLLPGDSVWVISDNSASQNPTRTIVCMV